MSRAHFAGCLHLWPAVAVYSVLVWPSPAQEQSIRPDVNRPYAADQIDLQKSIERFERADREVVRHREEILEACGLKPGTEAADVGAGTGLFTRPMAQRVSPGGKVYAVDITKAFLDHIAKTCRQQEIQNITTILSTPESAKLQPQSVDLIFLCDTYHHFEFPVKMLGSLRAALRPRGRLLIVDYRKEPGVSPEWVMKHIRADKQTVIQEVTEAGFKLLDEPVKLQEHYLLRFELARPVVSE